MPRKQKPPRIVVVIERGMVKSVHLGKRIAHAQVGILDLDRECSEDDLPDPKLAEELHTADLVEAATTELQQPEFTNHYRHCGQSWTDTWSCACNDECPKCGGEIEPRRSEISLGA